MGRFVLRSALGVAILVGIAAVLSMLANGWFGHAMVWLSVTGCLLWEWSKA